MQFISHVHNSNLIFNREIPIDISQQVTRSFFLKKNRCVSDIYCYLRDNSYV